jgi:hypothetical protein
MLKLCVAPQMSSLIAGVLLNIYSVLWVDGVLGAVFVVFFVFVGTYRIFLVLSFL